MVACGRGDGFGTGRGAAAASRRHSAWWRSLVGSGARRCRSGRGPLSSPVARQRACAAWCRNNLVGLATDWSRRGAVAPWLQGGPRAAEARRGRGGVELLRTRDVRVGRWCKAGLPPWRSAYCGGRFACSAGLEVYMIKMVLLRVDFWER